MMIIGGGMAYTFLKIKDTKLPPASTRSAVTVVDEGTLSLIARLMRS